LLYFTSGFPQRMASVGASPWEIFLDTLIFENVY